MKTDKTNVKQSEHNTHWHGPCVHTATSLATGQD